MVAVRRLAAVLSGFFVAAFWANVLFDEVLGLGQPWQGILILGSGALGAIAGAIGARRIEPYPPGERYDAIVGWSALVGGVAAVACLAIPVAWPLRIAAAVVVAALTILLLRRIPVPSRRAREHAATTLRADDRQA